MNYEELYELRKNLLDYKKNPNQTINILKVLEKSILEQEALNKSKILKTIHTLSNITISESQLLTQDQCDQIKFKANLLLKRIKNIVNNTETNITVKVKEKIIDIEPIELVKQTNSFKSLPDIDLFQNSREYTTGNFYADRKKYLTGISKQCIQNIQIFKNIDNLSKEDLQQIKLTVEQIEKVIFFKRQRQFDARKSYEQDMRTLGQYLKRDKNGSVTNKLFSGAFDPAIAGELRSSDWIDDETKQQQAKIIKEKMEAEQIGFYKQLSKREMEGIEGKRCKGCGEKRVYLVDEKQTRASDEPTTKFFECYNCGDKFRIC